MGEVSFNMERSVCLRRLSLPPAPCVPSFAPACISPVLFRKLRILNLSRVLFDIILVRRVLDLVKNIGDLFLLVFHGPNKILTGDTSVRGLVNSDTASRTTCSVPSSFLPVIHSSHLESLKLHAFLTIQVS